MATPREKTKRPALVRIAVTAAACAIALALSLLLRVYVANVLFVFFFGALAVAAWYSGFWGALFVIAFAIVSVNFFLMSPGTAFRVDSGTAITAAMFAGVGFLINWIAGRMRTAEANALQTARQLEDQTIELETQMEENVALTEEVTAANAELEDALRDAQEARHRAETANRAKSEFLAVMSHELRTPLNAIVGYTDILKSGVGGELTDRQLTHLERIRSSSWHLLELIQEVLSFARIEAGREAPRVGDVEITALARDVLEYVRKAADDKGIGLEIDVPDERLVLITDAAKVRQILLNLLSNAVKFTDQGRCGLRLVRDTDGVRFTVWDTGRGIAPADRDLIFEPFTQVDQSTTRDKGGTGLGLPVSRRLATMLGGSLVLESEPGAGSTFYLTLPMRPRG